MPKLNKWIISRGPYQKLPGSEGIHFQEQKENSRSSTKSLNPWPRVVDMRPDIQKPDSKQDDVAICQCILIALVFFYVVNLRPDVMKPSAGYLNLRTSADEMYTNFQIQTQTLGRISRSSAESSYYQEFQMFGRTSEIQIQTRCSNLPMYVDNIGFLLPQLI